jgi:hypothetical protein
MSDAYDLAGARKAGISDEDSLNHLASVNGYDLAGARAAGISDTDSLNHLIMVKAAPEPVVEKESPEALGGIGATIGAVGAAGDVIYSKGRPLFRMAEKAMGMDSGAPTVKPRTFLDPSAVAEQAIARRTATAPDVTGSPSAVKNWGATQHEGEFLGGAEYKDADRIKKEALAFEKQNPTQKVLPGSLIAVPEEEAKRLAQQRAELAAQQDIAKQAEVQKVAQTRAERLGERAELKGKSNQFGAAKGAGNIAVKVGAPVLGGYEAGSQGAQAYNRLTRPDLTASDVAAGATNIVGSGAGALSMVPSKYRIPAAVIAQGAGAIANFLDKRNPRKEEVEQKAAGGLAGYAEGGGPKLPGKFGKLQKVASGVQKAAHELHGQTPGRMTDWLQHNIGKFVVPTQSDRMGGVGGPSFSANSLVLPQYKGKAWGSGNEGTATAITNLAKDPRFGGPENQIFVPMLGHQNQHKSNQIAFDRLMKDFYEHPEKLTPELREQINAFMRSGGGMEKATGQPFFSPFADFDIADRDTVGLLGRSFDNRGLIAQHGFGGERLGGKKAQIFPYQQRLDEMADPTVAGAPTFAVGPRAFQLTGNVHPEPRPDLNAAFPYLLEGFDLNKAYRPVENSAIFQDFQNQWRLHKGKTEPLKSGKLPEPGYYENTIGYKVNPDDAERIYPRQEITEQLLDSMYKKGHAAGGSINMDDLQARKSALPDISLFARDLPNMTGQPGVGYMQTPQGAMARLQMEKELEKARLRAGVSGLAMAIPGQQGIKTIPGQMDIGANIPVGRGNLDISANRSINPIPGRGHMQGVNARYTMPFAEGGLVAHLAGGGKIPEAVVKAYKLFRTKANKPDELYPLFVNANKSVPVGEWVPAEVGPIAASGKVKSKLGELAYRPGWHAGDLPVATHIGGKSAPGLKAPDFRRPDEVWAEVEMPADVNWQDIANQRARLNKAGKPIPSTAHITDAIPAGGHYRYKTSPNMEGNWLIGGEMKVNRVLTDEEVMAINEAAGVADLPRFTKFDEKAEGGPVGYAPGGKVGALTELMQLIKNQGGTAAAKRLEKAADIVPNLETKFQPQALKSAFTADNASAVMLMPPGNFEKYAMPISKEATEYKGYRIGDVYAGNHDQLPKGELDDYLKYLESVKQSGGFRDVPFLNVGQLKGRSFPNIQGHEGRHRMRSLEKAGEEYGLVRMIPTPNLREPFPRRSQEEYLDALKQKIGNKPMVTPEQTEEGISRGLIELPEMFKKGGLTTLKKKKK